MKWNQRAYRETTVTVLKVTWWWSATYQPDWWWCLWTRAGQDTGSCCSLRSQPVSRSCRPCGPTGCWWTPWSQSDPAVWARTPRCRRSGSTSGGRLDTSCRLCCRRHRRGRPSPWGNATPGSQRFHLQWKSRSWDWMGHLEIHDENVSLNACAETSELETLVIHWR